MQLHTVWRGEPEAETVNKDCLFFTSSRVKNTQKGTGGEEILVQLFPQIYAWSWASVPEREGEICTILINETECASLMLTKKPCGRPYILRHQVHLSSYVLSPLLDCEKNHKL